MDLSGIPEVRFDDQGVAFKYLVFRLTSGDEEKVLLRGLNFRPYLDNITNRIINWTFDELESAGFQEGRDQLAVDGGGSASINPYYQRAMIFGKNPKHGPEKDRAVVVGMLQAAFPGMEIRSFEPGEEVKPPKPKRPAKKAAPKPAAKAGAKPSAAKTPTAPKAAPAPGADSRPAARGSDEKPSVKGVPDDEPET